MTLAEIVETSLRGARAPRLRVLLWALAHARKGLTTVPVRDVTEALGGGYSAIAAARRLLEKDGFLTPVHKTLKGEIVYRVEVTMEE